MLKNVKATIKYMAAAITVGVFGGVIGAAFAHAVNLATRLRGDYPFLLYFLPLGAVLTVLIYSLLRVKGVSTNDCFAAATSEKTLSFRIAPAVFICSCLTHLLGGSAGREGAALQLGGSASAPVSKLFSLSDDGRRGLTLSGMAAVFAAVFGTPFAAAIFVFEATKSLKTAYKLLPFVLISSISGYLTAYALRVPSESFIIGQPNFKFMDFWRAILVAGLAGVVCLCYCIALHLFKKGFSFISNHYLRGIVGAAAIILLTVLIGNQTYNGTGAHTISAVFEGETPVFYAFALKILFTAITIGCGFKGGEIVPAFFIGATFGAAISALLGLPVALGAAIGMVILFGGSTKCPIAAFVIALELFGFNSALLICLVPSLIVGYTLSGKPSLYNEVIFKKSQEDIQNGKEG